MIGTSVDKVASWQSVLAAMIYLATFLAAGYGVYAFATGAAFFESIAIAYPLAFAASVVLFASCAAVERMRSAPQASARRRSPRRAAVYFFGR